MLDQAEKLLGDTGWRLEEVTDLTKQYAGWYANLVEKIEGKKLEIIQQGGER